VGLEPDLENGKLGAKLDAEFSMEGGPLSAGLRFTDMAFSDKGELFGLARVEAKGTSSYDDESLEATVWLNRAGPGESCLSVEQLEAYYVRGEAPTLSVFAFQKGRFEQMKAEPCHVVAYCETDASGVFDRATESETQRDNWRLVGPAPAGAKRGLVDQGPAVGGGR